MQAPLPVDRLAVCQATHRCGELAEPEATRDQRRSARRLHLTPCETDVVHAIIDTDAVNRVLDEILEAELSRDDSVA